MFRQTAGMLLLQAAMTHLHSRPALHVQLIVQLNASDPVMPAVGQHKDRPRYPHLAAVHLLATMAPHAVKQR